VHPARHGRALLNPQVFFEDRPVYWLLEDAVDPDLPGIPPGLRAPVGQKLDKLLGRPVMVLQGNVVTVHNLIDQLAHIEGAVHSGEPKGAREQLLYQVHRHLFAGYLPAEGRQVQSIGWLLAFADGPRRRLLRFSAGRLRGPRRTWRTAPGRAWHPSSGCRNRCSNLLGQAAGWRAFRRGRLACPR